jgi:hypothetical protein
MSHTHRRSARTLRRLVLSSVAILAVPTTALAIPPTTTPPGGSYTITLGPTPCGTFTANVVDRETVRTFFNSAGDVRAMQFSGRLTLHLTSDITGRSMDLNVSGPGRLNPDGSGVFEGPTLLVGTRIFAYVNGRIVSPDSSPDSLPTSITGQRTDLCPILVG